MKLAYSLTSSIVFFITASIAFIAIKYSSRPKAVPKPGDIPSNSWVVTAAYIFITQHQLLHYFLPKKHPLTLLLL